MVLFLSFTAGILSFHLSRFFPFSVLLITASAGLVLLKHKKLHIVIIVFLSFLYAGMRNERAIEPFLCKGAVLKATATGIPVQEDLGFRQYAEVLAITNCTAPLKGKEIILFLKEPLPPYSTAVFSGDVTGTYPYRNPNNFRTTPMVKAVVTAVSLQKEEHSLSWYIQKTRTDLLGMYHRVFSPEVAGLLDSLVIGERSSLSDSVKRSFSFTGLSHLLSISGTHFGIFSFFIFNTAAFLLKRLPQRLLTRMTLYLKPSETAAFISIPFMVFYLLISGAEIPAIRSFIMINVFLFGLILGREGAWKNSLSFAAFVVLLISPDSISDVSFILSFSAVAAIGFAVDWRKSRSAGEPFIPRLRKTFPEKGLAWLLDMLAVTGAAIAGTLLITLYLFHSFSTVSMITNLLITPVVCFALIPATLFVSFIYLLSGIVLFPALIQVPSEIILRGVHWFAALPFSSIPVPAFPAIVVMAFYGGLILLISPATRRYGTVVSLISLLLIPLSSALKGRALLEVTFLDVGQGESSVMIMPDKKIFVLDTGRDGKQTAGYLDYLGVRAIDALLLTHAGADHAGGLSFLLETKKIEMLFDNGRVAYPGPGAGAVQHIPLTRGDVIEGIGYRLETLHPYNGFFSPRSGAAGENNNSLVVRLKADAFSILFTGDIEAEAEHDLLSLVSFLKSDVLKVPHHGSRTSSTESFVGLVDPSLAIISSGMFNPYGHPHPEALRALSERRIIETARSGTIKISAFPADEGGIAYGVKTDDQFRLKRTATIRGEIRNLRLLFATW
ncbi:MAG: DNA internalization-related competence protein ComEC/Rec2 [bacterium]